MNHDPLARETRQRDFAAGQQRRGTQSCERGEALSPLSFAVTIHAPARPVSSRCRMFAAKRTQSCSESRLES